MRALGSEGVSKHTGSNPVHGRSVVLQGGHYLHYIVQPSVDVRQCYIVYWFSLILSGCLVPLRCPAVAWLLWLTACHSNSTVEEGWRLNSVSVTVTIADVTEPLVR
ncbi:hypothetical protein E2C01_030157 [Portunus trituberculatus]|uniref:Uncharacterized protein n=1 Tax=Portunus trituberculatus TaxID=210409 RepID=A0A5B7EPQ3_PORTR|nr:hypothetical protein [Portunus trituberculatus]